MRARVPGGLPFAARRQRGHRGQGLVEFALVLPILMVLLLVTIDVGRLFFGWVALQNTSRIGANFAATNPDAWIKPGDARQALYASEISNDARTINCVLPAPLPTPVFPDTGGSQYSVGSRTSVTITCNFSLLTPFLSYVLPNPIPLSATTVYPIRAGIVGLPTSTPTPAPTPTPTPSPSPTSPNQCVVPMFIGNITSGNAAAAWSNAGFKPNKLTIAIGSYVIGHENPAGSDGTTQNCNSFALSVSQ